MWGGRGREGVVLITLPGEVHQVRLVKVKGQCVLGAPGAYLGEFCCEGGNVRIQRVAYHKEPAVVGISSSRENPLLERPLEERGHVEHEENGGDWGALRKDRGYWEDLARVAFERDGCQPV